MTALAEDGVRRVFFDQRVPFKEPDKTSIPFFDRIGRPDLIHVITPQTPLAYYTAEFYGWGIKGQGGLGMLASDTATVAKRVDMPMVFVTAHYLDERYQRISGSRNGKYKQDYNPVKTTPGQREFTRVGEVAVSTRADPYVPLQVYLKERGSVRLVTVTEPNFGQLYHGENSDDHRFYQEVALGFGGHKALKLLGLSPSMHQLNEAPTVFAAIARLDERVSETNLDAAFIKVKNNTIYTNHTLVPAGEAELFYGQFEHFVMPNIQNESVKDWLRNLIIGGGGKIRLSTLALELSGKHNGVSLVHAMEASKVYRYSSGEKVAFEPVTNGIAIDRWGYPLLLALYHKYGILDEFNLPTPDFVKRLQSLDGGILDAIKHRAKIRLIETLRERKDQDGKGIDIPKDAKIYNWKRRFADYKRPGMLFEDSGRLASILENGNIHLVMAGNAHPTDFAMQEELARILIIIHNNPILKERVHYIQNYDEELARPLAQGADVSINTPVVRDEATGERVSTEACATSFMKDTLGRQILISTPDGGVADPEMHALKKGSQYSPSYLQVTGGYYAEEVESLYVQMQRANAIIDGEDKEFSKKELIDRQLAEYLPIISGPRMLADIIRFGFPLKQAA